MSRNKSHTSALRTSATKLAAGSFIKTLLEQGFSLHQQGQFAQAEGLYKKVLQASPKHFDAMHLLGVLALQTGNSQMAVDLIAKAIGINGAVAAAHSNLGNALRDLSRNEEALASCDRALQLQPDFPDALHNRGVVLQNLGRYQEALASFDKALELKPNYAEAWSSRGVSLRRLGRNEEAMTCYEMALKIRPRYAEALTNRGNLLRGFLRFDEALLSYEHAQQCDANYVDAHLNEGFCRLLTGDFGVGWKKHEWRWQSRQLRQSKRGFTQPLWLGDAPLKGKSILLHAEQGFGDTLQFCRYAKLAADQGAEVFLEVQPALQSLLNGLSGVSKVLAKGDPLPDCDYHCPLLSLPLAFGTELHTIPADVPYLFSNSAIANQWQMKLGKTSSPRVGLVWSGASGHMNDHNRSIPLMTCIKLVSDQLQFISLQKEVRLADRSILDERKDVLQFERELENFSETAALISCMDLVISVDTSIAHLAGALGKPVWLLLPFDPDWRWLLNRNDSPWYPSARLFRQSQRGDWDGVISKVGEALRTLTFFQPKN